MIGRCFLLGGFPRCTSSWLYRGCSFVRFLASSLPVAVILGFSCWSLGALLPRLNLRFPLLDGVVLKAEAVTFWGFLSSFSFLVMRMPFWFLCVGRFLLLSFSSSCLAPLFLWAFLLGGPSSSSSVGGFGPGTFFVLLWFSLRLFSLVCRLLYSRFPLPSSSSSLVLFWSPSLPSFSFLFLPWLGSFFSTSVLLSVCWCAAVNPPLVS